MALRLKRLQEVVNFLESAKQNHCKRRFLQGDASPRAYERLHCEGKTSLVLLNALAQPDKSVGEARLTYMKATHLAPNDAIEPILAIGAELRARGFTVPKHIAYDIQNHLLLQEDLGSAFIAENGEPVAERYHASIDALLHMHQQDCRQPLRGHQILRTAFPITRAKPSKPKRRFF